MSPGCTGYYLSLGLEVSSSLVALSRRNWATLILISGHFGVEVNKRADSLARRGANSTLPGPELVLGIPSSSAKNVMANWISRKFQSQWTNRSDCRQVRLLIKGPTRNKTNSLFRMSRSSIRIITAHLRKHLNNISDLGKIVTLCRNVRNIIYTT